MFTMTINSLAGFPAFLAYFLVGALLVAVFGAVYIQITPHRELALIRAGNTAAAIGFAGAVLGYTVPLASAIAHSVGFMDMVIWALVAFLVQVIVLGVLRLLIPNAFNDIGEGRVAPAVFLATISLAAGIINGAAMTY